MKPKQVISHYGSQAAVAQALDIKQPSVSQWVSSGRVPFLRQAQIELMSGGQLRASGAAKKQYARLLEMARNTASRPAR